jgi:hypothetical protein
MRSLILEDLHWNTVLLGYLVVAVAGVVMLALSIRIINSYD